MIRTLYSNPAVLYQECAEHDMPEKAIAVSTDTNGLIVLAQGKDEILVNPESVNELCELLKARRGQK